MKQIDVKVGKAYSCMVSGRRINVVVMGTRKNSKGRTEYTIKREDNGRDLQPRSAAALKLAYPKRLPSPTPDRIDELQSDGYMVRA